MNQFTMVGQIDQLPELKEVAGGIKQATLILKVVRPFKESDGSYQYDYIPIQLWRGLAETLCACSKIDHWISVRGRVKTSQFTSGGKERTSFSFIAEHVGFIH